MIFEACREELYIFNTADRFERFRSLKAAYGQAASTSFTPANETASLIHSEISRTHAHEYLVEGFVTQSTQFYEVGKAEHPILDDEAQQLGERVQKTLYVFERTRRQISGQSVGHAFYKPLWAYPCCICSWDFQQTNDNPQTGIHLALIRKW